MKKKVLTVIILIFGVLLINLPVSFQKDLTGLSGATPKESNIQYVWCYGLCTFSLCKPVIGQPPNNWECPEEISLNAILNGKSGKIVFKRYKIFDPNRLYNVSFVYEGKSIPICDVGYTIRISTNTLYLLGCTDLNKKLLPPTVTKKKYKIETQTVCHYNEKTEKNTTVKTYILTQELENCGTIKYIFSEEIYYGKKINTTICKKFELKIDENGKIIDKKEINVSNTTKTEVIPEKRKILINKIIIEGLCKKNEKKSILECCTSKPSDNPCENVSINLSTDKFNINIIKGHIIKVYTNKGTKNGKEIIIEKYKIEPENKIVKYSIKDSDGTEVLFIEINFDKKITHYIIRLGKLVKECNVSGAKLPIIKNNTTIYNENISKDILKFEVPCGSVIYNYTISKIKSTIKALNNSLWFIPSSSCSSFVSCCKEKMKTCKPELLKDWLKDNNTENDIVDQAILEKEGNTIKSVSFKNTKYGDIIFYFSGNKVGVVKIGDKECNFSDKYIEISDDFYYAIESVLKHDSVTTKVSNCVVLEYTKSDKKLIIEGTGKDCQINILKPLSGKDQIKEYNNVELKYTYEDNSYKIIYKDASSKKTILSIIITPPKTLKVCYEDKCEELKDKFVSHLTFKSLNGEINVKRGKNQDLTYNDTVPVIILPNFCEWVNGKPLYIVKTSEGYFFALDISSANEDLRKRIETSKRVIIKCGKEFLILDQVVINEKNESLGSIKNVLTIKSVAGESGYAVIDFYDPNEKTVSITPVSGCMGVYKIDSNDISLTCIEENYTIKVGGSQFEVLGLGPISTIEGTTYVVKNVLAKVGKEFAKGVNYNATTGEIYAGGPSGSILGPSRGSIMVGTVGPISFPYTEYYYLLLFFVIFICILIKEKRKFTF